MFRRVVWSVGVISLLWSASASGYCRQRSCQDRYDQNGNLIDECKKDATGCIIEGDELFYKAPCLGFGVAKDTGESLGLSDEELESIVNEAFSRWENVDCGKGKHPGLQVRSAGVVETKAPHYCELTQLNLGVWFLDDPWPIELDGSALGYTTSTYAEDDAEVFDADVEINVQKILQDFPDAPVEDVLLSIITHEAGHFLGLGHSNNSDAVMATSYTRRDLIGRELTQDDIDGICEIYPPDGDLECSEPGVSEAALGDKACKEAIANLDEEQEPSCALQAPGRAEQRPVWLAALGVLGLGLVRRGAVRRGAVPSGIGRRARRRQIP